MPERKPAARRSARAGQSPQRAPDAVLAAIADYVMRGEVRSAKAYAMARLCLLDAMACALDAQAWPECTKLLGPTVPGATLPRGARVPGTAYCLEPVKAAFDISSAIRWLEYSDTWVGVDGGHPSDNLGAILAVADHLARNARALRRPAPTMHEVLTALIQAYEIQGVLYLDMEFIALGLDSVSLVTVAASAVTTRLLGGNREQVLNALSNAWLDGVSPRLYRMGENAGWRKCWAAGDAAGRAVQHALRAVRGEMGYARALSEPRWGFSDAVMHGRPVRLLRPLGLHVVQNVLFKIPFPAHFHTQTASECALRLHPLAKDRLHEIRAIHMRAHRRTMESTYNDGPLPTAASRDPCVQYVAAVVLLQGALSPRDFEDAMAADPRIDALRAKMTVREDAGFTRDFFAADKRAHSHAMRIEFADGSSTPEVRIDYPLGHPRRRREGLPVIEAKFRRSVQAFFGPARRRRILRHCADLESLERLPVDRFMALFAAEP